MMPLCRHSEAIKGVGCSFWLGTGLGSAMIVDGMLEPMEVAHLPYKNGKLTRTLRWCSRSEAAGEKEVGATWPTS